MADQAGTKRSSESVKAGRAPPHLMRRKDIAGALRTFSHPWNPKSEMRGAALAAGLGLTRIGVNFIRIAPGREAYAPHAHAHEEEWVFILEGRGRALMGEAWIDVAPGDFLAYPAPQVTHHLVNAGKTDLVCLMGGEVLPADLVDFPRAGKRMVWSHGRATAFADEAGENPFAPKPIELKPRPVPKKKRKAARPAKKAKRT